MTQDDIGGILNRAGLTVPAEEIESLTEGVAILDEVIARLDYAALTAPAPKT